MRELAEESFGQDRNRWLSMESFWLDKAKTLEAEGREILNA